VTPTIPAPLVATPSAFDPEGRLAFEPEPHRYSLRGPAGDRPLISVTQAIESALAGTLGEEHWTEEARLRGQYVHEAILLHSQDDLDESTLHPLVAPFFSAYLRFRAERRVEVLHLETPIYDEEYGYGGTFDLLGRLLDEPVVAFAGRPVLDLIDVKSGSLPYWVRWQLAGYRRPIQRAYPDALVRPWVLHLRADGTYRLVPAWAGHLVLSNRRDEQDWLSILRVACIKRDQA